MDGGVFDLGILESVAKKGKSLFALFGLRTLMPRQKTAVSSAVFWRGVGQATSTPDHTNNKQQQSVIT